MIYGFVSDIHANRQAWSAVMDDMLQQQVDVVLCLGDIVGYGPMPAAVFESVCEQCEGIIIGNHDAVVGGRCDPEIFNDNARRVIEWTQRQLGADAQAMFADMHIALEGDDFVAVHADIVEPDMFWYIEDLDDAEVNFEGFDVPLMFVGHTHNAGIFIRDEDSGVVARHDPVDFAVDTGQRYIVNVGSVGDPRNGNDVDACYVTYDTDQKAVFYHRIPFDIDGYQADLRRSGLDIVPAFLWTAGARMRSTRAESTPRVSIAAEVSTAPRRPRAIVGMSDAAAAASNAIAVRFEQKRREAMALQELAESLGVVARRERHSLDVRKFRHESQPINFAAMMEAKRRSWEQQKEQEAREKEARAGVLAQRKRELQRAVEDETRLREERKAVQRERAEQERLLMREALRKRQEAARQKRQSEPDPPKARHAVPVGSRAASAAAPAADAADAADRRIELQQRIESRRREREAHREQQRERARLAIERKRAQGRSETP